MNIIDYRFYRTKKKEMVYGFEGCSTTYVLGMWENEKHVSEPMQYTGLKDMDGNKIYEGDIVKQSYSKVISVSYDESSYGVSDVEQIDGAHIGEIITIPSKGVCMKYPRHYSEDEGKWSISNQYKDVAGYRSKVIGNIHEDKHLLEDD